MITILIIIALLVIGLTILVVGSVKRHHTNGDKGVKRTVAGAIVAVLSLGALLGTGVSALVENGRTKYREIYNNLSTRLHGLKITYEGYEVIVGVGPDTETTKHYLVTDITMVDIVEYNKQAADLYAEFFKGYFPAVNIWTSWMYSKAYVDLWNVFYTRDNHSAIKFITPLSYSGGNYNEIWPGTF